VSFDTTIRLLSFLGLLLILAGWEFMAPRRQLTRPRPARWFANLSLIAIDNAVARLVFPVLPVGMALIAQERGWGLFNHSGLPEATELVAAILFLDLIIYVQHRLFHRLPLFWRLHRMHHTDQDLDVTSGNRFHPIETTLSFAIKLAVVVALGASPAAVLWFEVILNGTSMFSHANIRLNLTLDHYLRQLLVTPDMHRVHHSVIPRETDSNFGFCLPWWDRLFGTDRQQPAAGHLEMTIGLKEFRDPGQLTLPHLLVQPFVAVRKNRRNE
jgi:sterol desaturase/sphingolipid hydroxylase (fatty acid hydroxylase superfamily)